MNEIHETVVAGLIIFIVFYFSIRMVIRRIKIERELIDVISNKLTLDQYKELNDYDLKNFILNESKELMKIDDYTIATFPFVQDSLYGQSAYMKRFREYLENALTED